MYTVFLCYVQLLFKFMIVWSSKICILLYCEDLSFEFSLCFGVFCFFCFCMCSFNIISRKLKERLAINKVLVCWSISNISCFWKFHTNCVESRIKFYLLFSFTIMKVLQVFPTYSTCIYKNSTHCSFLVHAKKIKSKN